MTKKTLTWNDFHSYLPSAGTFSKDSRSFGLLDSEPAILMEERRGCYVYDGLGRKYTDWISGLGGCLLGGLDIDFNQDCNFSLPSLTEYEAGKSLVEYCQHYIPEWNSVDLQARFMTTGTEACDSAIRLARAATGRLSIASQGYHGWASSFIGATPPHWGVESSIDVVESFEYGQLPKFNGVAAVIIEQPAFDPPQGYPQQLRQWCDRNGALLIMDEVVTGFRYARGGASELYGFHPDIVVFGKALAEGLKLSAIVAEKSLMSWFSRNDPVFVSSTSFGNPFELRAMIQALSIYETDEVQEHVWNIGGHLLAGLQDLSARHPFMRVIGHPPRSVCLFENGHESNPLVARCREAAWVQGLLSQGILLNRPNFPTWKHSLDDVEETLNKASEVLESISELERTENLVPLYEGRTLMKLFTRR